MVRDLAEYGKLFVGRCRSPARIPGMLTACHTSNLTEPINAFRIRRKQFLLIGCARRFCYFQQGLNPLAQRRGLCANGPVAAEHDAFPAETGDDVFDGGTQIVKLPISRPAFRFRIHDDARYFANDVGRLGYFSHARTPARDVAARQVRVAAMIEDELCVGASRDQTQRQRQLATEYAKVERQLMLRESLQVRDEMRAE